MQLARFPRRCRYLSIFLTRQLTLTVLEVRTSNSLFSLICKRFANKMEEESLQVRIKIRTAPFSHRIRVSNRIQKCLRCNSIQFLLYISSFSELSINTVLFRAYLFTTTIFWLERCSMDALRTGKLSSNGIRLMVASITCRFL